jgi:hypothetical protein
MTSPHTKTATKKKPTTPTKAPTPTTRKEARTSTLTKPTISSKAKVLSTVEKRATRIARPRGELQRTQAVKSGLSILAKEAVDRHRARQAQLATKPVPAKQVRPATKTVQAPPKAKPTISRAPVDAPAPPSPKTKRAALISTSALHRTINDGLDEARLTAIYGRYYTLRQRSGGRADVYNMLGEGDPAYVDKPVGHGEFTEFKRSNPVIEAQGMWPEEYVAYRDAMAQYDKDVEAWILSSTEDSSDEPEEPEAPPKDLDEAVARGDYFHVHNTNKLRPAQQDTTGRSRRIVVNVNSQQAGLKVAGSLSGLFDDPVVSPYLEHYKIFLTEQTDEPSMKHDKLVVYYEVPPGTTGDMDPIGDRIAAAIDGSIDDGEFSDVFAPFYSRVGRGIAWAEEPGSYVEDLDDSFTGTRASIIDGVLNNPKNATVDSPAKFIELVRSEFRSRFVDPQNPHRHLQGKPPPQQTSTRRTPPGPVARPQLGTASPQLVMTVPAPRTGQPQPVATAPQLVITSPQPLTRPPQTLNRSPQLVVGPPRPVITSTRPDLPSPQPLPRPPQLVSTSPQPLPGPPQTLNRSPHLVAGPPTASVKPATKIPTRTPLKPQPPQPATKIRATTGTGPVPITRRHTN